MMNGWEWSNYYLFWLLKYKSEALLFIIESLNNIYEMWEKLNILDWENKDVRVDEEEAKWTANWANCGIEEIMRLRDVWGTVEWFYKQRWLPQDIEHCVTIVWAWTIEYSWANESYESKVWGLLQKETIVWVNNLFG